MPSYLDHLNEISAPQTFERKKDYIRYNFGKFFRGKDPSSMKILEVGPGLGELISFANDQGISAIDVIDNDGSILGNIRDHFRVNSLWETDSPMNISGVLDQYDLIILTQVFEHLPEETYSEFLRTLFGSLKAGGRILITVPNMGNPFTITERYSDLTHRSGFTEISLRRLAASAGIDCSEIKVQPFRIPPSSYLNVLRIGLQKMLHLSILSLSIINGGTYAKILTPNITLIIKK